MTFVDTLLDRLVLPGNSRIGYRVRSRRADWPADPPPDALKDADALVTGAGSGLGTATAAGLARLGARVHLLGRHLDRLEQARAQIVGAVPDAVTEVEQCDLSVLARVHEFAEDFRARVPALRVLVHNAGTLAHERVETEEGNELDLATHVLGPFLLTGLLRANLAAAAPSRVIFVTSSGMYGQRLRSEDPQYLRGDYRGITAYARTKRMQVVLAEELAPRLADDGITVHSVHPGWAETPGLAHWLPRFRTITRPLLRTVEEGADTTVWVAAAPEPAGRPGRLWHDRAPRPTHLLPHTRETPEQRAELWRTCERLTGLTVHG
ncbi:MAG: SDR family NAD(P)-dependent oxidoreductase [Actinophytocola sp.]|uniref:SDR family NAD(P)-dependent oxidoreductase n=1 Tax=Actinophytocola sp. TaxID=1872138 RepID=UPI003D6A4C42